MLFIIMNTLPTNEEIFAIMNEVEDKILKKEKENYYPHGIMFRA